MAVEHLTLRVHAITFETSAVRLFELREPHGRALPPFAPGAHIDLHLPDGLKRSYSLIDEPTDGARYLIGVQREAHSRGGSRTLHERVRVGDLLGVSLPINHFPLVEDAQESVFIAGGIGITPILTMLDRLAARRGRFSLHYGGRNRDSMPFRARLAPHADRVRLAFSRDAFGGRLDVAGIVAAAPEGAELYCCGPRGMLEAFTAATAGRDPGRVHVEHFVAAEPPAREGGFRVELARSGRTVYVPAGTTILDALIVAGLDPPCSCLEGVCGQCETHVIEGLPDHRDRVLSPQERAANKTMMLCCSGSRSGLLVLDM